MEAKELRLGNWIFDDEEYIQVTAIEGDRVYNKHGWCFIDDDCPSGIPLTPEILEKAGFVKESGTYNFQKLSIILPDESPFEAYKKGRIYYSSWAICEYAPQYLHQLQNLFYSLTGKELTINL